MTIMMIYGLFFFFRFIFTGHSSSLSGSYVFPL